MADSFNSYTLGAIKVPCHNCTKRTLTCDKDCKEYQEYKKQVAEFRKKQKQRYKF